MEEMKEGFEVTELEDDDLDDVAGGGNSGCNCGCPCRPDEENQDL